MERRHDAERRKHQERRIWFQMAAIVALIASIWASSYTGRKNVVNSQRSACERGKLDRRANAAGWRTAEAARRVTADTPVGPRGPTEAEHTAARLAARRYDEIASALEARSRIDCNRAFPAPKLLEFR